MASNETAAMTTVAHQISTKTLKVVSPAGRGAFYLSAPSPRLESRLGNPAADGRTLMVDPCERNPLHPRRTAAARGWFLLAPSLALLWGAGCAVTTVDSRVQSQAEPIPAQSTLAVVPFENLSSSRNAGLALTDLATSILYSHDYFRIVEVSGLQEEKELRFRRLETAPWERQVGVNPAAAAAVGRSAKADCVLAGAVGEYGFVDGFGETAAVSVTLRLVRSANAEVVWAGSLSRRVASSAFSEESAQRLAHEGLRDLLGRMIRELTGDGR